MTMTATTTDRIDAFSFMGLLAGEGKIPGTESGTLDKTFVIAAADEMAREFASDLTAEGDFFDLMTEAGAMRPAEKAKPLQFKITRPRNLGGGFGDLNGGNFGGGAFAH